MIQEYRCLQLGDPLAVGAKIVLSPSCATRPLLSTFFICVVFFVPELEEGSALWRTSPSSIKHVQGALRLTVRTTTPQRHVEVVCRVQDWVV